MPARWGVVGLSLLAAMWGMRSANAADAGSAAGLSKRLAIEESRSGVASPHLLPLLDRLAGAQIDDGALGEAAASRRRALKIALRAYGGDSTNAANAMIELANIQILRQRYVDAEPLLSTALSVLESRLGASSPALAAPLAALSRVALARGDTAAAEDWAKRAVALTPTRAKAEPSEPLRALGAVYAAEQRFDDGETILRAAVARDRQHGRGDNLELARSLAQLASLLLRAQRFAQALPVIEQAIAIDQNRLRDTNPLIADDFADLGLIYAGLGRDADAADALYFAIDLLERGTAEESTRLGYTELEIAPILRRLGQSKDADAAFKDAKHILDKAANDERDRDREL